MLLGFKPDEVQLTENNKLQSIKNIIIGIYNKKLSNDGEYSALIHPDILNL
jgi:stage II sporulation protein GA (sporulation sigma-E factor processing peptidase)